MRKTTVLRRPFSGDPDIEKMAALVRAYPGDNLHLVDLPYRVCSPALDDPNNVGLWTDGEGNVVAWAVLQTPFWTLDYAYVPDVDRDLHRRILAWGDRRACEVVGTPSGHPAWFVNVLSGQEARIPDLEGAGFTCQASVPVDPWTDVLLWHDIRAPIPANSLPAGYGIRSLAGSAEVAAYVAMHRAVFESCNMTADWRFRTLQRPEYRPELDLVAVAPDGSLVGCCVCWIAVDDTGRLRGQIEPMGVCEGHRRRGVGRALVSEGLRRLRSGGATGTYVQTENYRGPALGLYESVGFRVVRDVWIYRKDYGAG